MQVGASTTASQFRSHLGPTISRCADRCEQALKSSSELKQNQSEVSLMKNMLVTTLY
jgi:hypothetical protein